MLPQHNRNVTVASEKSQFVSDTIGKHSPNFYKKLNLLRNKVAFFFLQYIVISTISLKSQ